MERKFEDFFICETLAENLTTFSNHEHNIIYKIYLQIKLKKNTHTLFKIIIVERA